MCLYTFFGGRSVAAGDSFAFCGLHLYECEPQAILYLSVRLRTYISTYAADFVTRTFLANHVPNYGFVFRFIAFRLGRDF